MPFADKDKLSITILRQNKRYSSRRFLENFSNRNWTRHGLNELIDSTGLVKRAVGFGRARTVRSDEVVAEVADVVQNPEDQLRTHSGFRQIAREVEVSRTSVHRVSYLKCMKRERAQELTEANRSAKLQHSRQLLKNIHHMLSNSFGFPLLLLQIRPMISCTSSLL
jgi:hypothetical protein